MSQIDLASYFVRIHGTNEDLSPGIQLLMEMENIWIKRIRRSSSGSRRQKKKQVTTSSLVNVRPLIKNIRLLEQTDSAANIEMMLGEGSNGKVRPEEVLSLIIYGPDSTNNQENILPVSDIHKIGSFIEMNEDLVSPMDILNMQN